MSRIIALAAAIVGFGAVATTQAQFLPAERLPGPGPSGANFGAREIRGVTAPNDLAQIISIIQAGDGDATDGSYPILDATDPDTNADGGPFVSGTPAPFLTDTAGDDDDIIQIIHGTVDVPSAGDYTIQVRSDDGFGLRFPGIPFTQVFGAGQLDTDGSMVFPGGTGDSNSRGVISLPAGQTDVEMVWWERGGGAYYEVTSAQGIHQNDNSAQWLALGDGSTVPAGPTIPNNARLLTPAFVINGPDGDDIPATRAAIASALNDPTSPSTLVDSVTLGGGDMPNGGGDEYTTGVFGHILVDDGDDTPGETIPLTFTLRSDDGSSLRIVGSDFTAVGGDERTELREVDGDMVLTADFFTGNTNALGLIELQEGVVHPFEAHHFEGGGGDNLNIFHAAGDQLAGFNSNFFPLSISGDDLTIPANAGLAAVPEPSSIALLALGLLSLIGVRRRTR